MVAESSAKSKPVIPGLFTWPSDNPQLIGTKCHSCNSYYFPVKKSCNNPDCQEKKIEDVLLSTRGKLWSFSVLRYPPSPPFKTDKKPPFPIGLVELPEGIRVLGLLSGCKYEDLKIGMEMKLVIEPLYTDETGQQMVTWMFAPVDNK
jgi:uncharacterized protein